MDDTNTLAHRLLWVLWPAFLVACVAEIVVFSLVDPHDVAVFGRPLELPRETVYALGFFLFWGFASASSALTVFLARSPWELNRCPLPRDGRPDGCAGQGGAAVPPPRRP